MTTSRDQGNVSRGRPPSVEFGTREKYTQAVAIRLKMTPPSPSYPVGGFYTWKRESVDLELSAWRRWESSEISTLSVQCCSLDYRMNKQAVDDIGSDASINDGVVSNAKKTSLSFIFAENNYDSRLTQELPESDHYSWLMR